MGDSARPPRSEACGVAGGGVGRAVPYPLPAILRAIVFGTPGLRPAALHDPVQEVEIVDPRMLRFRLKEPWPDFMTFYGTTASAAGIVVPKKYLTEVGDDGFKKHPIGAGPYKFVGTKPGIEIVLEANPDYWRRVPAVKTLVIRSVPGATNPAPVV